MKKILFAAIVLIFSQALFSAAVETDELDNLCRNYPQRIEILFAGINLDYAGLEMVKDARARKDDASACRELLKYYESCESGKWLRKKTTTSTDAVHLKADEILKDTFVFQEVRGIVPRNAAGKLDWNYSPNDDFQWTLFLNRHFHLSDLMNAYFETDNSVYFERVNNDLRDWITSNTYPGKGHNHSPSHKSWQWSLLEVGSRAAIWPQVFYGLYSSLAPDVKILVLSSVPDHFNCIRNHHSKGGNHLAIELRGLAAMAGAFPEFKESGDILDYSAKVMTESLFEQVYPDGVQKELTVHYHGVAYRCFSTFAQTYKNIDRPLSPEFNKLLDFMLDYMAYVQRPNGRGPLNNDSDYVYIRKDVAAANQTYNRGDWAYIISNGREGEKPRRQSVFYPYAGQAVMRNGWDENAHWSFFDIGPWGSGHRHSDKLHLSITAYGKDLLVDSGRFTYVGYAGGPDYPWREYFISAISHNIIMIDGKGQKPKKQVVAEPLTDAFVTNAKFDFARGQYTEGYDGLEDKITHTRAVLYLRDRFWVVVDRVECEKPHRIEALWRYHPDCDVVLENNSAASVDAGKANLRITPVSSFDWDVELVKGQEKPFIQGWYSVEYNKKTPNSVAVYSANIQKTQTFAWLITVDENKAPHRDEAKILSESSDTVRLKVGAMTIDIPMAASVEGVSVREE